MTNTEFAIKDDKFKASCEAVGLPNKHKHIGLARQAGKWRRGKGLAYKAAILKMDVRAHIGGAQ
uniref:Uncharacterized protein n=1 Tax=viral metagenome TaxID=1070528 RepID=A0A6M3LXN9_9ZZZZ